MNSKEVAIGRVIKRNMAKMNLSLRVIGQYAKVPYSTLYSWSENRTPKDIVKAKRLAELFKISMDELLFDERGPDPKNSKELGPLIGRIEVVIKQEQLKLKE